MTEQAPEAPVEGEQAGPIMPIKMEGSVTDGVFRIDAGVEDTALVTLQFNSTGAGIMDQLLAVVADKWDGVLDSVVEAFQQMVAKEQAEKKLLEAAVIVEEVKEAEAGKHRALPVAEQVEEIPDDEPAPHPSIPTGFGEGINPA